MIRDLLKWLAVLVAVALVVFDVVATIQGNLVVRQAAVDAAEIAQSTYVQTRNDKLAMTAAKNLLSDRGDEYMDATIEPAGAESAVVKVTAMREIHTYLFRYLTRLPWRPGRWCDGIVNPEVTRSSD